VTGCKFDEKNMDGRGFCTLGVGTMPVDFPCENQDRRGWEAGRSGARGRRGKRGPDKERGLYLRDNLMGIIESGVKGG